MVFLYTSTTIVYYLLLILMVTALSIGIISSNNYIFLISIGIFITTILGLIITIKLANKKYIKSLSKIDYDIHSYLDEQYKFLNKLLISKSIRNIIKINIAAGFMNNEQFDEALKIFSEFAQTGYQGLSLDKRFLIFMNQAKCYMKLNRFDMVLSYIQNSEIILRTARFPANIRYELSLIFEYTVAEYNYKLNLNPHNIEELINKINDILNNNSMKIKSNYTAFRYEAGALYMQLGDTARAEVEFDYILRTGSSLPCVNRIKAYNETGDMNILKV